MLPPADLDGLSHADLKSLVLKLLEEVAELRRTVAQRDEIARLKGGPGRPNIKPSGMDKATEPRPPPPTGSEPRQKGGKTSKLSIHEERTVTIAAPPQGSRFKGYTTPQRKAALRARFDRIFTRKTGFVTLDRLLVRLHANKHELLMVLDRPEIPLHTNGSENDVRCQVTKRKVSGGTRSDTGRDCRDAFLGLSKTCAKLGFAFWDYLGSRLAVPNQPEVPYLPAIVRHRCATA